MVRYAEGTTVTVESSRGEITGILAKHGVVRMAWGSAPEGDTLQFELGGASYRFSIERPTTHGLYARWEAEGKSPTTLKFLPNDNQVAAEWRRRWRAHVLLLKAKLEFAASGDSTLIREFMPYRLLKDGRTLEAVIEAGSLPMLATGK